MSEQMDIISEQDEVAGNADVSEIHRKALLHRAVHIFIIDSQGRLFCRQRSFKKERYPGFWSTSVGAHVMQGQSYDLVAKESLKDTLGIECKLKMIGRARVQDNFENEISGIYIGYSGENLNFNSDQIEGGKFLSVEEIKELIVQRNVTPHLAHSLEVFLNYKNK